jgi:predicted TIM-barrel fold metal-dependent hydrolase
MHNDIDVPFAKTGQEPYQAVQLRDLFLRHPQATIVWAHAGLGRVVHPMAKQIEILDRLLSNPMLPNVHIDLSWTEAAKYIVASPASVAAMAALINRYPDRFLFGTDEVAPADQQHYLAVYDTYAPLLSQLTPAASEQFRKKNYERLFDEARRRVRAWERVHIKETGQ